MPEKTQTLRKKHDAITDELKRYKLLVDNVQDYAIFLMDKDGHILTWNKGAQKNKGYKPEEIIGKHFSIFYMEEDVKAKKPEKELAIARKLGRAEDEDWRIRKDGSKFWASVVITALFEDDELVGFAKVTRDLTERKSQEDELRQANQLLRRQQEELRNLNKSKDEFISLASHQLRTPATAIKQLLGIFVDGIYSDLDENHMKLIKKAYDSNDRQINIVNSLLKVAQIDAGKVKLSINDCDLDALIENIIEEFEDTFQQRRQSVEYIKKSSNNIIKADKHNLRMCLENIISNASKYTYPHGSIRIILHGKDEEIMIIIEDSGVGIAADDIELLFQKFKRLPNELSEEVGGSGLGLYWAEKIVRLHNGQINVTSELNKGSTFKITLPVGN